MRLRRLSVLAALASVIVVSSACARGDHVTSVAADDAKVNAAMGQARATLPVFFRKFDAHDRGAAEFRIKAKLDTPSGGFEHIWVDVTSHDRDGVSGTLANDPENLGALKFGSPVTVPSARISDWMYLKRGKLYGGYTIRALLDRGAPDERRKIEAMLPPTPLEPNTN